MKLLFSLVMMNHYICCGWYMMGTRFMGAENSPEGETWVDRYFDESHLFAWRYMTALQWSLAQFTPSATEIRPMNTWERLRPRSRPLRHGCFGILCVEHHQHHHATAAVQRVAAAAGTQPASVPAEPRGVLRPHVPHLALHPLQD